MHKRHIDGEENQQTWDEAVELEVERFQRGGTPGTPVGNEFFTYLAHTAGDSVQAPARRILNACNMPFFFCSSQICGERVESSKGTPRVSEPRSPEKVAMRCSITPVVSATPLVTQRQCKDISL